MTAHEKEGTERKENIMSTLSRRQFLRASGTVVGATLVPSLGLSGRARAAERELVPKKMPFPPNDEFGSYEPTITPDGRTLYFMSRRSGNAYIWATHKQPNGEWTKAQSL